MHPYIERNVYCRAFVAARELQENDDKKFLTFYRMSKESYLNLVHLLTPFLQKNNTNMRECVSAEERILITLRYANQIFNNLSMFYIKGFVCHDLPNL